MTAQTENSSSTKSKSGSIMPGSAPVHASEASDQTPTATPVTPAKTTKPTPAVETKEASTTKAPVATAKPDDVPEESSGEILLENKNAKLYKVGIFLLLLIFTGTAGIFYLRTKISTVSTQIEIDPEPEIIESVVASPAPSIVVLKRSEITLEILNGTSTSGLAGKTAKKFEELGYEVKKTGNADDSEKNQLHVKAELAGQLENLLDDVKKELEIVEITEKVDDLDTTARIILGGE